MTVSSPVSIGSMFLTLFSFAIQFKHQSLKWRHTYCPNFFGVQNWTRVTSSNLETLLRSSLATRLHFTASYFTYYCFFLLSRPLFSLSFYAYLVGCRQVAKEQIDLGFTLRTIGPQVHPQNQLQLASNDRAKSRTRFGCRQVAISLVSDCDHVFP